MTTLIRGETIDCSNESLIYKWMFPQFSHVMLDHRQYVDLFEPCFKLLHNAPISLVQGIIKQLKEKPIFFIWCNINLLSVAQPFDTINCKNLFHIVRNISYMPRKSRIDASGALHHIIARKSVQSIGKSAIRGEKLTKAKKTFANRQISL